MLKTIFIFRIWIPNLGTRRYFVANRTTTGTHPPGSEWTKNPVANCAGLGGGFFDEDPNCPSGFQFPPHLEGLWGQGISSIIYWAQSFTSLKAGLRQDINRGFAFHQVS